MRASPEFELIEQVREALRSAGVEPGAGIIGIGDDAAVTPAPEGVLVTSVDLCVEGVHFTEAFSDEQIGHKALAAALSDLAAMGAQPLQTYVGLIIPPGFKASRAVAIAGGIGRVAASNGVAVLGGDISAGAQLALAVTVIGTAPGAGALVPRAGAQAGDSLIVSGALGGAAAGLTILRDPVLANGISIEVSGALKERQCAPWPKIELGRALAGSGASAMIDISDGVLADSEQIASESGVGIELWADQLPIAEGVAEVASSAGRDPISMAGAGEDYELLATVPPDAVSKARAAAEELGERLTEIGVVATGSGVDVSGDGGALGPGFDHLSCR